MFSNFSYYCDGLARWRCLVARFASIGCHTTDFASLFNVPQKHFFFPSVQRRRNWLVDAAVVVELMNARYIIVWTGVGQCDRTILTRALQRHVVLQRCSRHLSATHTHQIRNNTSSSQEQHKNATTNRAGNDGDRTIRVWRHHHCAARSR